MESYSKLWYYDIMTLKYDVALLNDLEITNGIVMNWNEPHPLLEIVCDLVHFALS